MNTFLYDKIFIVLPGYTIPDQELTCALEDANDESDIKITKRPSLDEVYREAQGAFHTSGLMPSRPREEKVARLGIAWFTDELGRKHIRIASDMKKVKFHESNIIWPNMPAAQLVYPKLQWIEGRNQMTCDCGRQGSLGELKWNGIKCHECQENDRYAQETGFEKYIPTRFPRRKG